ncbi:hypothetical protein MAHJHV60_45930 [Mycobacterium avium subsp. hominissuis]
MVFARLVVPTGELLDLHAQVHRLCAPHLGVQVQQFAGGHHQSGEDHAAPAEQHRRADQAGQR